ncbi:hypothetical protein ACF0H5_011254 [Mactra antiquata]
MATMKLNSKQTLSGHMRRQTTWIRSEGKLKQWRKTTTNGTPKLTHRSSGMSSTERKSDVTRSGRLSDGTIHSNSTGSSSERGLTIKRLQDVDDIEQKESIEKCLKWMETLPDKFSGMHIFVQPPSDIDPVS